MIFIGIDPGKSGALAVLYTDENKNHINHNLAVFDENDYIDILTECSKQNTNIICCLEKVSSMPKQGVVSMFSFGMNFGFIQGILSTLKISYELVVPSKWKKEFSVTSDKNTSIQVAKRLFPNVNLRRTDRCKKDHDGMAEALLMAEYARRKF